MTEQTTQKTVLEEVLAYYGMTFEQFENKALMIGIDRLYTQYALSKLKHIDEVLDKYKKEQDKE